MKRTALILVISAFIPLFLSGETVTCPHCGETFEINIPLKTVVDAEDYEEWTMTKFELLKDSCAGKKVCIKDVTLATSPFEGVVYLLDGRFKSAAGFYQLQDVNEVIDLVESKRIVNVYGVIETYKYTTGLRILSYEY